MLTGRNENTLTLSYERPRPLGRSGATSGMHGTFDGSRKCAMKIRVFGVACPKGWGDVHQCRHCKWGFVKATVKTTLTRGGRGQDGYKCQVWFVYADTTFRNTLNKIRTNWATDRVSACARFAKCKHRWRTC